MACVTCRESQHKPIAPVGANNRGRSAIAEGLNMDFSRFRKGGCSDPFKQQRCPQANPNDGTVDDRAVKHKRKISGFSSGVHVFLVLPGFRVPIGDRPPLGWESPLPLVRLNNKGLLFALVGGSIGKKCSRVKH